MTASCERPERRRSNALDRAPETALPWAAARPERRSSGSKTLRSNALDRASNSCPDGQERRATTSPAAPSMALQATLKRPRSNALDRRPDGPPNAPAGRGPTPPTEPSERLSWDSPPTRSNALDRRRTRPWATSAAAARTLPFEVSRPPETTNPGRAGVVGGGRTGRPGLTVLAPWPRTSPRRTRSQSRSASRRARSARRPTAATSGRTRSGPDSACCETRPGP